MAREVEAHVMHPASIAVSREHRRAKTDRLDSELLKRAFVGWLRGERDTLVAEQSRLINRMRSTLVRFGVRGFNPKLKSAADRLDRLRTPDGTPIPPNTLASLKLDLERRDFILDQIRKIENERIAQLEQAPDMRTNAMVRLLARVIGIGIETADVLVREMLGRTFRDRR